jgi:hypothetical protein
MLFSACCPGGPYSLSSYSMDAPISNSTIMAMVIKKIKNSYCQELKKLGIGGNNGF